MKLPLAAEWNHRFFFYACGGFCGTLFGDACNLALERGFASAPASLPLPAVGSLFGNG
jgi:hypothetical protein